MVFDRARREFLGRDLLAGLAKLLDTSWVSGEEKGEKSQDYFSSFELCHPLLADAGEFLYEEAARLGIETAGRSREDIAREIFSGQETRRK